MRPDTRTDTQSDTRAHAGPAAARLVERPAPRWRPYAAVAAVLLLGLLSAALFGGVGSRLRSLGAKPPTTCAASQLKASLPAHSSVESISMTSATDGWAVGDIFDTQHETTPPQTLLLHFHDCAWAPAGEAIPTAQLYKVAMGSSGEGWAVGATAKRQPFSQDNQGQIIYEWEADQPFLLHYSGGHWQRVELPGIPRVIGVAALRMVSADEGWLLLDHGGQHTDPYTKAYSYTLLHYQGGAWNPVPLTFKAPTTILWDLAATAPDDCWLVGYGTGSSDSGGLIAHYSGGTWQKWNGTIGGARTYTYYTVAMTSPHDVWAIGNPILHYDGVSWTSASVPNPAQPGVGDPMSATMISPGEGWAFPFGDVNPGNANAGPPALHYVNGQWQALHIALASPQRVSFVSSLTMASATQGWARGAVYVQTSYGATPRGVLVFYDNGTWTVVSGQE